MLLEDTYWDHIGDNVGISSGHLLMPTVRANCIDEFIDMPFFVVIRYKFSLTENIKNNKKKF